MSGEKEPFHEMVYLGGVELPDGTVFRTTKVHELASDSKTADGPTEDMQLRTASPLACLCLKRAASVCYAHRLPVCQEHVCACGRPICEACGASVGKVPTCLICLSALVEQERARRLDQEDREFWGGSL